MDMQLKARTWFGSVTWLALGSVVLLLGSCQETPTPEASTQSEAAIAPAPSSDLSLASPSDSFITSAEDTAEDHMAEDHMAEDQRSSLSAPENKESQDPTLSGNVPPELVPATTETERLPQVQQGRTSPFDSLPVTPYIVRTSTATAPTVAPNGPLPAPMAQTIPTVPVAGTPPAVVPVPLAVPSPPTNIVPVPLGMSPSASPRPANPGVGTGNRVETSTVNSPAAPATVEFTGVVQLGDRVSLIVREPGATSSRYVHVGDAIANGQFIIKAVDFSRGPTPAVILDQAGRESIHWVGSSISTASGI